MIPICFHVLASIIAKSLKTYIFKYTIQCKNLKLNLHAYVLDCYNSNQIFNIFLELFSPKKHEIQIIKLSRIKTSMNLILLHLFFGTS